MTGDDDQSHPASEPIDADFEPAAPTADYVVAKEDSAKGPGWIALGITGVTATLFGGLIAGGLDQAGTGGVYAPESLVSDVQVLAGDQQAVESNLETLRADLASAEARLAREISGAAAASGDNEALASLTAEIETLNGRLDALQVGEDDLQSVTALVSRIDALERADEDEVTSPRLANRAITALRNRVDEIEDVQTQIANRQTIRAEALADLLARVETLEAGGGEAASEDLDALKADVEALKAESEADQARSEEVDQIRSAVEELQAEDADANAADTEAQTASRALFALLTIEAAAREGRSFQSAHGQLAELMPGDATVEALAPLAVAGVPTLAVLQSRFDTAADAALSAVGADAAEDDGWNWVRSVFGDDIEVRRSGSSDDVLQAAFDTAREALDAQDLGAAVEGLEALEGPGADAMGDWLDEARNRLLLDDSLNTLRLSLLGAER